MRITLTDLLCLKVVQLCRFCQLSVNANQAFITPCYAQERMNILARCLIQLKLRVAEDNLFWCRPLNASILQVFCSMTKSPITENQKPPQAMKSTLLSEARDLSVAERLKLVEAIWDSIAESPDQLALTTAQAAELDRRLAEYEKNPEAGTSWDEVKERILKRS